MQKILQLPKFSQLQQLDLDLLMYPKRARAADEIVNFITEKLCLQNLRQLEMMKQGT